MGIDLYWDDEAQTTILAEVDTHWTWDQAHRALNVVQSLADKPDGTMQAAIVDVSQGVNLPDAIWSPTTLMHARRIAAMAPQGTGPVVVVGVHPLVQRSFEFFRRLYPRATANVHVAETQDAARALIARKLAAGQGAPRNDSPRATA